MLKDKALGERKTVEKTSSEVSRRKHELQEETELVRTGPRGQKARNGHAEHGGPHSPPGSPH